jgi:GDP/UDP-N,N'-diacetylbacillosamine 2-epimerase (hydrolysing)
MYWIIKEIEADPELELQLIVTGMHLSPEFGMTFHQIEESGIPITKKVEILLSSDTVVGISKSMGLGMISFAETFQELEPDIIVVLGDRFEIFSAAAAAMIARVPIAHIHGGEATEGLIDEPIRHSITKMSHLHFTATEAYRKRVIQLGESPDRVLNVGTPGLDNINKLELLSKTDFEVAIDLKLRSPSFIVTFHPVTLEEDTAEAQFTELLNALDTYSEASIIFTKPNADTDGRKIIHLIDNYVNRRSDRTIAFTSMGQLRYLSALKHVDVVLGNSSSGLVEAPSFGVPTVNIGDRQKGRIKARSVIDCHPTALDITQAIDKALSDEFRSSLNGMKNPYGEGGASELIVNHLKSANFSGILKKAFFNIPI